MIAWESYGNRWRLHPGVSDTIARAIQQEGLATMCRRIGVNEIALETAAYRGVTVRLMLAGGFRVLATSGTAAYLASQGLKVETVKKVLEGRPHIVDAMKNGEVQLVFNTTEGKQSLSDSFELRRTALMMKIPYFTTSAGALAAAQAIAETAKAPLEVRPLQSYA